MELTKNFICLVCFYQTIAIISVRDGIIQLGSFDKVFLSTVSCTTFIQNPKRNNVFFGFRQIVEDLNVVISIQRKFNYLQSIPGVFAMQRPYLPLQHPYILKPINTQIMEKHEASLSLLEKRQSTSTGMKRLFNEMGGDDPSIKSINMGWNTPQNGTAESALFSIPNLLPPMSCSLGALLSKLPSVVPSYNTVQANETSVPMLVSNNSNHSGNSASQVMKINDNGGSIKVESSCHLHAAQDERPNL